MQYLDASYLYLFSARLAKSFSFMEKRTNSHVYHSASTTCLCLKEYVHPCRGKYFLRKFNLQKRPLPNTRKLPIFNNSNMGAVLRLFSLQFYRWAMRWAWIARSGCRIMNGGGGGMRQINPTHAGRNVLSAIAAGCLQMGTLPTLIKSSPCFKRSWNVLRTLFCFPWMWALFCVFVWYLVFCSLAQESMVIAMWCLFPAVRGVCVCVCGRVPTEKLWRSWRALPSAHRVTFQESLQVSPRGVFYK